MQNLNEAYFGKNKNIEEIQKNIGVIIDAYKTTPNTILTSTASPKIMPALTNIEKLIKKEFGFNQVVITTTYGFMKVNAFTYNQPLSKKIIPMKVVKTKSGVRCVTSNMNLVIVMGEQLFSKNFTAEEVTAILLHEIGHNFFSNNNYVATLLAEFNVFINIANPAGLINLAVSEIIQAVMPQITKLTKKSGIKQIVDMSSNITRLISSLATMLLSPLYVVAGIPAALGMILQNLGNLPKTIVGMSDEKFADNFATAYGYGPALSSGLVKMDTALATYDKSGIVRTLTDLGELPIKMAAYVTDVHPNTYARIKDQINYSKSQLSNIKDPRVKSIVQSEIKQMEQIKKSYEKVVVKSNNKNNKYFSAVFTAFCISAFDGNTIHDLCSTKDPKTNDWVQFKSSKGIFD